MVPPVVGEIQQSNGVNTVLGAIPVGRNIMVRGRSQRKQIAVGWTDASAGV